MELDPGSLVVWIILGLLAGWMAGFFTLGRGFGCLGNIALGLVGAIVGGWLFTLLGVGGTSGFLGSLIVATIGAATLLIIARIFAR